VRNKLIALVPVTVAANQTDIIDAGTGVTRAHFDVPSDDRQAAASVEHCSLCGQSAVQTSLTEARHNMRFCSVNHLQLFQQAVVDIVQQTVVVIKPAAHKCVCEHFLLLLQLVMT